MYEKTAENGNIWFTEEDTILTSKKSVLVGKNGDKWFSEPPPRGKTPQRNIVCPLRMPCPKRTAK